jgi:endonuclease/exonuclease/phosphatase family metal-dependent hydrolase
VERTIPLGWWCVRGDRDGQAKTALIGRRGALRPTAHGAHLLSRAQDAGPGAGPDRVATKWLRWVELDGAFRVGVVHLVASSYKPRRDALAERQVARIVEWVEEQTVPVVVVGDFNMTPGDPDLAPLRRAGLTVNHDALGPLPTHGKRAIDHLWASAGVTFDAHEAVPNRSDHHAVVAQLTIA